MTMKALKILGSSAMAGLLALAGCVGHAYVTDVSVERRAGGVSDYTVVPSLPENDVPTSMPVVVESKSRTVRLDRDWSGFLWFGTLGLVPFYTGKAKVCDVTVRTPLGERSGTCAVEENEFFGLLAFLFIPCIADELYYGDPTRHANEVKWKEVRDGLEEDLMSQLEANLVSQFSKEEYASYREKRARELAERARIEKERAEAKRIRLAKEAEERARIEKKRAEAERIRLAKEAEEARRALHGNLVAGAVGRDLARIRQCYSEGNRYKNPFLGDKGGRRDEDDKSDWLARWASPRLALAEADALAGEARLSEFGAKYLPNAYANYEKRREALAEIQQVFNEEFPQPWTIRETSPKWHAFNKVLERFVQARTEAFLCHDELCHYWLLWRFGVLSAGDLAAADAERLSVPLLPENVTCAKLGNLSLKPLEGKIADFAAKYAPASSGLHQKMAREFKELDALLAEIGKQRRQMDDVRHSRALTAAVAKRNKLARELNALSLQLQTWHMDHRTAEKSADDVARCDADMAKKLKPFLDSLPGYVKERTLGIVIAASELVAIPGKGYRMQRTEVTQLQWLLVMGSNPSRFQGLDRPVENVSWNDCQEFIRRASARDGRQYRLPTEAEWEYACRAGNTGSSGAASGGQPSSSNKSKKGKKLKMGKHAHANSVEDVWGKRANGECGPLDVMGWYGGNSGGETHPVAQKEPNAWGLYDMHGNVLEWCQDLYRSGYSFRVYRGGGWNRGARDCAASYRGHTLPDYHHDNLGFRLVAPQY